VPHVGRRGLGIQANPIRGRLLRGRSATFGSLSVKFVLAGTPGRPHGAVFVFLGSN
jgi:hypothetical protein